MQIEAAFSLSEEYYKFMSDFAQTSFEDDKLLGKFYTDFTVAKRMVETIWKRYGKIRLILKISLLI